MFIISPKLGLCNQLQTITKGILLSIKYNRNLYIDNFQIDLDNNDKTYIGNILNIKEINEFLENKIQTTIKIVDILNKPFHDFYLPTIDYNNISNMTYINDIIELNQHMEIIYLGNITSLDIDKSFAYSWNNYSETNLYYFIISNLRFHDLFYNVKDYIKQYLKLTTFNCMHLRIEDDALVHFSSCYHLPMMTYNEKLIKFYDSYIQSQTQKTYVCSGILKFHNTINLNYYKKIIKKNNLCDKDRIPLNTHFIKNRELIAIVDLLIAFDSEYFIGSEISSFSQLIMIHHKLHKKESLLFNPTI